MVKLEQLKDGCYRLTLDVHTEGLMIHKEWTFAPAESDAEVSEEKTADGFTLELKIDQ